MISVQWLSILATVCFAVHSAEAAATIQQFIIFSLNTPPSSTITPAISMTTTPVTILQLTAVNSYPATTTGTCYGYCDNTGSATSANECDNRYNVSCSVQSNCNTRNDATSGNHYGTLGSKSACTCTNPLGALYQCSILYTNPPAAFYKIIFEDSQTTTSGSPYNICALKLQAALNTGEYIYGSNSVFVYVNITLLALSHSDTTSTINSNGCASSALYYSGWYNFTVVPITTTTSTSTTTTVTTTTPTVPTTTTIPTSTSTSTSTSTTTQTPGTTQTTTSFIATSAGIATLAVCCALGAILAAIGIYYAAKACGACAPTLQTTKFAMVPESVGAQAAKPTPLTTVDGQTQSAFSYSQVQNSQVQKSTTPQPNFNNYNQNSTYLRQSYMNSGTPNPTFAKTGIMMTPVE